jgi:hypothetical protein
VALVLMFALLALFLQVHNLQSEKQENKVPNFCRRYWELSFFDIFKRELCIKKSQGFIDETHKISLTFSPEV